MPRRTYAVQDAVLLSAQQTKLQPFAVVVNDNRAMVSAIRVNYFSDGDIFKVVSIVDQACRDVRRWDIEERPGETVLQNWDTVIWRAGDLHVALRLGHNAGVVGANYLRLVVP